MGFENVYVTKLGLQLEAKSRTGKNIKILRVDVGDGELIDDKLTDKTSLIHKKIECEVNSLREIDNQTIINFILQQRNINEGFYFREFGVIAEEPDTKEEILYMYANAGDKAEFINDKTSIAVNDRIIDIVVKADNTDNISISINNTGVYIEREEYQRKIDELQNDVNTKHDFMTEILNNLQTQLNTTNEELNKYVLAKIRKEKYTTSIHNGSEKTADIEINFFKQGNIINMIFKMQCYSACYNTHTMTILNKEEYEKFEDFIPFADTVSEAIFAVDATEDKKVKSVQPCGAAEVYINFSGSIELGYRTTMPCTFYKVITYIGMKQG